MIKYIFKVTSMTAILSPLAYSQDDKTFVHMLISIINGLKPSLETIFVIAFIVGVFFIGQAGYKLRALGKDQQIKGGGIVTRFVVGGLLVAIMPFASLFTELIDGKKSSKHLEEASNVVSESNIKKCFNSKKCDQY